MIARTLHEKRLRIGCTHYLPLQQLQAFLGLLYEREPRLHTDVMHVRTAEALALLHGGALDIAILHDALHASGLDVERIYPGEPLAAFVPIGHRLERYATLGPGQLADELVVWPASAAAPALVDEMGARLTAHGYRLRHVHETAGVHPRDVLLAAAQLSAVALAPASTAVVAADAATIVVRRPLDPAPRMPDTVVAWSAGPPPVACLRAIARELRGEG